MELVSKDKLKHVSDLACYVQCQKSKQEKLSKYEKSSRQNRQIVKSTSLMSTMDALVAKAGYQKMGQFLDFCNSITTVYFGCNPEVRRPKPEAPRTRERRQGLKDSLRTTKLGLKRMASTKRLITSKTMSSSTIESTDIGYQSQTSDIFSQTSDDVEPPQCRIFSDDYADTLPRHSTPIIGVNERNRKERTADNPFDVTLVPSTVYRFDEEEGKSMLMRRFMADSTVFESKKKRRQNIIKSRPERGNTYTSAPVLFRSQKEKCRFYWDMNFDTDSDSSCSDDSSYLLAPDLDEAFIDDVDTFGPPSVTKPQNLIPEFVMSDLNDFELRAKPVDETYCDSETVSSRLNYSFSFSFSDNSEIEDFSVDSSCSDTESDLSRSFGDYL